MSLKATSLIATFFVFGFSAVGQNPFNNPSFENTSNSAPKPCDNNNTCQVPDAWDLDDCNSEGALCRKSDATDGSYGVGVSWTNNTSCCNVYAEIWQDNVSLTGICEIAVDQIGPDNGNPDRSDHIIYIDGTQVQNCGYVDNNQIETCYVDVSSYNSSHTVTIEWNQRSGDNLGNSVVDNMRVTESESQGPSGASASPDTLCEGESSTLSVNGGFLGAGGSWEWYTGSCGGTPVGSGPSINVSPSSDTTYYVRAEGGCNSKTSCASVSLTVEELSTPPDTVTASPASICRGEASELSQNGGVTVDGSSFQWYRDSCGGNSIGSGNSVSVAPTADTVQYFIRAEGDCKTGPCESVELTVDPRPVVDAGRRINTCGGDTVLLGENPSVVGGTPPYQYFWAPADEVMTPQEEVTMAVVEESRAFTLRVVDDNGCENNDRTEVIIEKPFCGEAHIFIPNAFSPNGDGVNDELKVRGKGISSFQLMIFDRWGDMVFSTHRMENGWDGTLDGEPLPAGVYFYRISGSYYNGEPIERKGNITLLR